jgi:hypothetical protein
MGLKERAARAGRGTPETDNSMRDCLWSVSSNQFSTQRHKDEESRRKDKPNSSLCLIFGSFAPLRETFFLPYIDRSLFEG